MAHVASTLVAKILSFPKTHLVINKFVSHHWSDSSLKLDLNQNSCKIFERSLWPSGKVSASEPESFHARNLIPHMMTTMAWPGPPKKGARSGEDQRAESHPTSMWRTGFIRYN
ncbi:hypothetical protein AVEN_269207-1 [Araneus ventricosus]|uniref:Uncharacterized protein n=1 Tax=Araneus ventricosus TaxID=182803 RepID=A0A4Y2I1G5_ARAVE|nr:hypothetical protein AVEN_269207-1 [Araneus ventricosus]